MVSTIGYVYPWDIAGDPNAVRRIADTGVEAVALATTYHTTRAPTPFHPRHRIVDAEYAAYYPPLRPNAWAGAPLVPAAPGPWFDVDTFPHIVDALRSSGLSVYAWVVLAHNSRLGAHAADCAVVNAFGDRYPHALCPTVSRVQDYCETVVSEVGVTGYFDGVILEAAGQLGLEHGGHHDKVSLAGWSMATSRSMSVCFCTSCRYAYAARGIDPDGFAAAVRAAVSANRVLPDVWSRRYLEFKRAVTRDLQDATIGAARARAGSAVTVHASAEPWAYGSFPSLAASVAPDSVVGPAWNLQVGIAELTSLSRIIDHATTGLGAYIRPDILADDATVDAVRSLRQVGVSELHLYHLGMFAEPGLNVASAIISEWREGVS